ncbi:hypothetical protein [Paucibacter sp. DJ2R-2]|jgi:hypothetical protein|uniref:hypothetical protein n=1 Tax=Paucibacter sp. DJ2R-2 TaxID=2893558 RepID=UPI0021E51424|nr:hypothetical protein [Paucibacter sp. DJ2R-2]MCV2419930.1 hypothetical protein [Paucibacter sp. DJ4R-1]MCV2437143.1 hypothetical protein [Paucibacter sp. DJ2R-2]
MNNIDSGVVRRRDSGVWEIVDGAETVLARYSHAAFPDIVAGSDVYFVRNPADGRAAINVQPVMLVDESVEAAAPTNGYNSSAEARLRSFIMDRLLAATRLAGDPRKAILRELAETMDEIKSAAEKSRSKKVTLVLLTSLSIP